MRTQDTTTGRDINTTIAIAEILSLAVQEPGTLDDARDSLNAIEDAAKTALFARR